MSNQQQQQSSSRFGGSSSRFGSSNTNNQQRRLSPFGRINLEWSVVPITGEAVRITLEGLGDPFHRILGKPLNKEFGKTETIIDALQNDEALHDELVEALNENWAKYEFSGAAMLYPWTDDIKRAFNDFMYPLPPQPENKSDDEDDTFSDGDTDKTPNSQVPVGTKVSVTSLRAIDPAFVMNVLARSRSNIVVANTPLALEPGFLTQSYICDDPRIVRIARATGYIEEKWS